MSPNALAMNGVDNSLQLPLESDAPVLDSAGCIVLGPGGVTHFDSSTLTLIWPGLQVCRHPIENLAALGCGHTGCTGW